MCYNSSLKAAYFCFSLPQWQLIFVLLDQIKQQGFIAKSFSCSGELVCSLYCFPCEKASSNSFHFLKKFFEVNSAFMLLKRPSQPCSSQLVRLLNQFFFSSGHKSCFLSAAVTLPSIYAHPQMQKHVLFGALTLGLCSSLFCLPIHTSKSLACNSSLNVLIHSNMAFFWNSLTVVVKEVSLQRGLKWNVSWRQQPSEPSVQGQAFTSKTTMATNAWQLQYTCPATLAVTFNAMLIYSFPFVFCSLHFTFLSRWELQTANNLKTTQGLQWSNVDSWQSWLNGSPSLSAATKFHPPLSLAQKTRPSD